MTAKMAKIPSDSHAGLVASAAFGISRLLVDHSALHDELHLPKRLDVLDGVALDRDQVREQALLDRADRGFHVEGLGGGARRRLEGLNRRETVIHEHFDLARALAVREDADVAAVDDGDARFQRGLEAHALRLEFLGLRSARLPAAE